MSITTGTKSSKRIWMCERNAGVAIRLIDSFTSLVEMMRAECYFWISIFPAVQCCDKTTVLPIHRVEPQDRLEPSKNGQNCRNKAFRWRRLRFAPCLTLIVRHNMSPETKGGSDVSVR